MPLNFDQSELFDNGLPVSFGTDEQRLWSRLADLEFGDAGTQGLGAPNARRNDFTEYEMSLDTIRKIIQVDIGIMSDSYSGIQKQQIAQVGNHAETQFKYADTPLFRTKDLARNNYQFFSAT